MTTGEKKTGTQTQDARRKGGADGKAKKPEPKNQPAPGGAEASAGEEAGTRSRKITNTRR